MLPRTKRTLLLIILIIGGVAGWLTITQSTTLPTPTPTTAASANMNPDGVSGHPNKPVPTPTSPPLPNPPTPSPGPTEIPRKIPLRRSDSATTDIKGQSLYRLVEDKTVSGNIIADHLDEDEMMCVQPFNLPPTECICWVGPLENAGITGTGTRGMRRVIILNGSVEEAALAVAEDWNADLRAAGKEEHCPADYLVISYDGGLFKPQPDSN